MLKKCFLTQNGPKAICPYSTAVIHGDTCYLSGVIPVVPATGKLAEGGALELHADDGYAILLNPNMYSDECGLEISSEGGEGFFA